MAEPMKGTVTSLSSIFPVEEAHKASKRVHDAIADHHKELDSLHLFIADNDNLFNLVQRIPDELHHDVMVPFGKSAFFPGRLIHTNEFLVLLGEGYYVERTSRQTIEVLKRRGKALETHVDSLKAVMQDLKAEASFFDTTAAEAAEGLVEIREDLTEENPAEMVSKTDSPLSKADNKSVDDKDEQYAQIMSRLDELEKEELAAESFDEHDGDAKNVSDLGHVISRHSVDPDYRSSKEQKLGIQPQQPEDEYGITEEISSKKQQDSDHLNSEDLMAQPVHKDVSLYGKNLVNDVNKSSSTGKALTVSKVEDNFQTVSSSNKEVLALTTKPRADSLKAFTGSIVEHSQGLQTKSTEQSVSSSQASGSRLSKPVSRFKMQRR